MSYATTRTQLSIHAPGLSTPLEITAHVLRRIGVITPSTPVKIDVQSLFRGFKLADPDFSIPKKVDLILGADVYSDLLLPSVIKRSNIVAQQTIFSWTLTGGCVGSCSSTTLALTVSHLLEQPNWQEQLLSLFQRFWHTEEVPQITRFSPEEIYCEELFNKSHQREESGRYVVPLPVKPEGRSVLGESLTQALKALRSMH